MSVWEKYELILDLITLTFRNSDARPIRRARMRRNVRTAASGRYT